MTHQDVISRRDFVQAKRPGTPPPIERVRKSILRKGSAYAMVTPGPIRRQSKALPNPPSAAIIALNRAGFGPRPGDIAAFNSLGADDTSRLTSWVEQQLAPQSINDAACDARINAAGFTTINKPLAQLWEDHIVADPGWAERNRPLYETERLTFLRAIFSKRQLQEVLADFWHNHFNVYAGESWIAPIFVHYDRDVIRANMLGNFHTMLTSVARSTEMLAYLDNYTSTNAGPNENFAREMLELHTLGAENYLGVMRQSDVPLDNQGRPIGYVDDDVYETTRCMTGWTFDSSTGLFNYRSDWHDRFQKNVLGVYMPPDQPDLIDGNMVLYALAEHPGTGRHIARKLCRRLISDNPPEDIVNQAAEVFTNNISAPDQLTKVMRTILLSDAFLNTWAEKIKRPFEIAVSAMRAGEAEFSFAIDESDFDSFLYRYDQCGQPLFYWRSPDGFPDVKEDWQSTTPRVATWRLCSLLIDADNDEGDFRLDVLSATPPGVRSANAIADFWIQRVFGRPIPASERHEIVEMMAQGHNPDSNLPLDNDSDTRERLRAMVGVLFNSPTFLWR